MPIVHDKYRGTVNYSLVYSQLIMAARYRGSVTYQEIADIMGLPLKGSHMGKETGHILGEISEDEVSAGRPMLSAIALGVSGKPGPGFFALAELLKLLRGPSDDQKQDFWKKQRTAVYDTWGRKFK
jgi:hypothetical protein